MLMKFFRKHNKKLLAIFMAGLMIVFIGGSALEGLLTPQTNPVIANSIYGPVTLVEQNSANQQTNLLDLMGVDWRRPIPGSANPITTMDWILLRREAQALGTTVTPEAIRAGSADGAASNAIVEVARRLRVKPDAIHTAMADFESVQRAAALVAGSTIPSEAELQAAARDALEAVTIRAVVLPAEAFVSETQEFSDKELQSHFDKYREKERGQGLNFGYFREPSLRAQYIKIDREKIASAVGVANLDRKAKSYFEEHRTKDPVFRKKGPLPGPDPAAAGLIEGPPGPAPDPFLDWESAKDIAVEALRKQYADQAADRIANWLVDYADESWLEVERGKDGYKIAPKDVARLEHYDDMVRHIPASMAFPGTITVGATDFFTAEEAADAPEIGGSVFRSGPGVSQPFAALAFRTKAIIPDLSENERTNMSDYLATFQTSRLLLIDEKTGNRYVFRIVDSKGAHAPESVALVRDQVVKDLRLQHGYESAKTLAESLRSCAPAQTLREAYEGDADLVAFKERSENVNSGYTEPPPISRVLRHQASRGRPQSGMFAGIGIGNVPNEVVDQFFAMERGDEKIRMFELKERAAWLVAEWVETKLPPEDEFNTLRKQLISQLADARLRVAAAAWLDPAKIQARSGFVFVTK